ncbi:MAG: leucine-rich repeat domain-containing protein [Alphaproteobacteria bacterium]|nr:leucine-rich repeat domain-containing protein [Alphaproteobacteria bacterium]
MKKWILIMAVMMFICETRAEKISCVNGKYANGADCQSCGTNCNWSFDTNSGHLEVSGGTDGTIGTMADFTYYDDESTTQPWDQYKSSIISLKVSGIENIGDYAFVFARHLKEIKLDDAITNIGMAAFNTTSLQSITLPDSLNKIEGYAFENTPLQSVVISDALTNIELVPFSRDLNVIENLQIVCRGENCDAVKEVLSNYEYYNQISEKWETTDVLSKALSLAGESQCNSSGYYWDGASCQGKKNGINCQGNYRQNNDYCNRIIYTIDEANKVAGDKNRVSITYR